MQFGFWYAFKQLDYFKLNFAKFSFQYNVGFFFLFFFVRRTLTTMAFAASSMPFSTARHQSTWPNIYSFPSSNRMSHSRSCTARRSIRWQPLAVRRRVRPSHRIRRVSQSELMVLNGRGRTDCRRVQEKWKRSKSHWLLQKCHFKLAAINIFYSTFNTFPLASFYSLFPICFFFFVCGQSRLHTEYQQYCWNCSASGERSASHLRGEDSWHHR